MKKLFLEIQQVWNKIFFPVRCICCKQSGYSLCPTCAHALRFASEIPDKHIGAIFDYGDPRIQKIIREAKYHRHADALKALTTYAAPHCAELLSSLLQSTEQTSLVFVPIPQHTQKNRARGFSQSELIAKTLARYFTGSTVAKILVKRRHTPPQAHMQNKKARLENVAGSMHAKILPNKKDFFVVIDDVSTTGATMHEAFRALQDAGATKIYGVTLAHGYAKQK